MTFKHQYKVMIGMMVLLACTFMANAQDEEKRNTGESLGKQYRNNRVPGLQYAPEQPKALRKASVAEQQENHSESSGMQLKKGTIKGMRFAQGGGGGSFKSTARSTARSQSAGSTLPSDQKPGGEKITPPVNGPLPTQGGAVEPAQAKPALEKTSNTTKPVAPKEVKKEHKNQ
jgi:hypothetical protein